MIVTLICLKHSRYAAKRKPRARCPQCRRMWAVAKKARRG